MKGSERVRGRGGKDGGEVGRYDVRVVESGRGEEGEGVVGDGGGACFAKGVDEVSSMCGSLAEGGEVGPNGPGPVRAVGLGVEGGGRRFEGEGGEGCGVRLSEDKSELFS